MCVAVQRTVQRKLQFHVVVSSPPPKSLAGHLLLLANIENSFGQLLVTMVSVGPHTVAELCVLLQFTGRWHVLAARQNSYLYNVRQMLLTSVGASDVFVACMTRVKR